MMNRIIVATFVLASLLPSFVQASMNGWLSGVQLGRYSADYTAAGEGYTTFNGSPLGPAAIKEDQGNFAGRIFLGYSFNQYLETELGLAHYQPVKFENIYGVPNADVDINLQAFDLVGKVKLPLNDFLSIYGKLGAAYVKKDPSPNNTAKTIPVGSGTLILPNHDETLYRTIYGLGVTYDLNTTFSLELGWSRIDGKGQFQQTDFGFVGIVYYFDQFLT